MCPKRTCRYCGKEKAQNSFAHGRRVCRQCRARYNNVSARYGLTKDQYNALRDAHGGKCGCCGQACNQWSYLSVDHVNDSNGKPIVRGLLCHLCNSMLAHARDDIGILKKAIEYLERFSERMEGQCKAATQ